jgi:hypothetical protein
MDRNTFTTAIVSLGFEADSDCEFWLGRDIGLRLDESGDVALLDANGRPANGRHGYDDALDHLRRNLGAGYGTLKEAWEVRKSSTARPVAEDEDDAPEPGYYADEDCTVALDGGEICPEVFYHLSGGEIRRYWYQGQETYDVHVHDTDEFGRGQWLGEGTTRVSDDTTLDELAEVLDAAY